jgi:predicted RNA binding protein YcfA (HicA-like mRNA interferase family)
MPKLPRDLSGNVISHALERAGFIKTNQEGSHRTYRKGSLVTTVPMHRRVKTGTLRGILRDTSITVDQFLELL